MNKNFPYQKFFFKALTCLAVFSFHFCGEAAIRKEPFAITTALYENRSPNSVLLAHAGDACTILLHKRIHNILFFWPINGYSKDEIVNIANQKMIRYKNTLRAGDLLWNLLFFTTFLTYTVDVETCETGLITIARHEFDYLKEGAREKDKAERYKTELDAALVESGKKSEKINLLQKENEENKSKTQYVEEEKQGGIVSRNSRPVAWKEDFDRPILKNYKEYILKQFLEETQPFTILFSSGKSELAKEEKNKLELYAKEFKEKYFQNKILLIGHSDWTGHQKLNLDLSFERANLVSKYLIKIGVPEDKIHITFSGGLWPENNGEKLVKSWNRRVDLLILE